MIGSRQGLIERSSWESASINDINYNRNVAYYRSPHTIHEESPLAGLVETIQHEVIPRLVLAHRATNNSTPLRYPNGPVHILTAADIDDFSRILLAPDSARIAQFIESKRAHGLSVESIFLDLLAPAARHLGELWSEDLCNFCEVTLGLCALQQTLRDLSPVFSSSRPQTNAVHHVLLAPCTGEQHTFGLYMVAEFFRRDGWTVTIGPPGTSHRLVEKVRKEWFAVLGLSLSCDDHVDNLAKVIRVIRQNSRNRSIGILVGGRVINDRPELVRLVGADATAVDGRHVVKSTRGILNLLPSRC